MKKKCKAHGGDDDDPEKHAGGWKTSPTPPKTEVVPTEDDPTPEGLGGVFVIFKIRDASCLTLVITSELKKAHNVDIKLTEELTGTTVRVDGTRSATARCQECIFSMTSRKEFPICTHEYKSPEYASVIGAYSAMMGAYNVQSHENQRCRVVKALSKDACSNKKGTTDKWTAGILPFTIDPETKTAHFLLGTNCGMYDNFYGGVEEGETVVCGAAREGFEESKGVIGSQQAIFMALSSKDYSVLWNNEEESGGKCYLVNVGPMTSGQREALEHKFTKLSAHGRREMKEITSVRFVQVAHFKTWCENDDKSVRPSFQKAFKEASSWVGEWKTNLAAVIASTTLHPMSEIMDTPFPLTEVVPPYQWGCLGLQTWRTQLQPDVGFTCVLESDHDYFFTTEFALDELALHLQVKGPVVVTSLCGWKRGKAFAFAVTPK